jgi:hypothetical protein
MTVFDSVINICPETWPGGLKDVIFRNDFSLCLAKHFFQYVKPEGMSRLGAKHVVGYAKSVSMPAMGCLFRTENLFLTENAAIFAKRIERFVARDVQVKIEPAARIHHNDAEEINPLDVGGVVVIKRKKVR